MAFYYDFLKDMVASLVKENEETSAVFVFIFASHSPDGAVAEQISRITEIFKTSAVLKGKPKVLIHQTIAAGLSLMFRCSVC